MKHTIFVVALVTGILANALAQSGGDYDLSWSVISSGGVTFSTGGNFQLGSTIGQPVALGASSMHTGGNWDLTDGFWYVRYALLSGVVHLLSFGGNPAGVPVELQIRAPGSLAPLQVHTLALSASGAYSLVAPLDGVYDLSAKASHWLRQTLASVSVAGGGVAHFSLVNGDIDGDNEVTLFDFGALVAAFGSMPGDANWNPEADLDGDEEVTLFDFGVLVSNFGAVGDD
ncbi:MAG: hypothetical protein KatS3mg022_1859 [Armatimonadota bacterium]|nr:MAG: hypothetical protein KatS3mg022_1859 [Armatimonadota bacterium]